MDIKAHNISMKRINASTGFILRSKQKPERSEGFTLIELLVVIAIIAIMAGLLMANFVGIRQRARDAQRKSDLRQIQSALELYRSDQGVYPSTVGGSAGEFPSGCGVSSSLTSVSNTTYMKKVPCDPTDNSTTYTYTPSGGGTGYSLIACLENSNDLEKDSSKNASCSIASFTVTNP